VVYRAFDRELAEEIAIKVMSSSLIGDERDRERLKREIVTARKITHPT